MKTLIIYPDSETHYDAVFHLLDPDTGEHLASHFCSGAGFARSDLHNGRPERLKAWEEKFGDKTEAKFIDETSLSWDEIYSKNQKLKENDSKV